MTVQELGFRPPKGILVFATPSLIHAGDILTLVSVPRRGFLSLLPHLFVPNRAWLPLRHHPPPFLQHLNAPF
jgi:hypothetical protein